MHIKKYICTNLFSINSCKHANNKNIEYMYSYNYNPVRNIFDILDYRKYVFAQLLWLLSAT